MQFYLFVQRNSKPDKNSAEPTVNEISAIIAHRLNRSSVLIVSTERILQVAGDRSFCSKQLNLKKWFGGKRKHSE